MIKHSIWRDKEKNKIEKMYSEKEKMFCGIMLPDELLPPWIWGSATSKGSSGYY